MYVITVLFTVYSAHRAEFVVEMVNNARISLEHEPGCRQFDVCTAINSADEIFLYEIYDSRAAFDAHLASEHFQQFNQKAQCWVKDKVVNALTKI
ncbi:MAG: antibiotic biosynthesis monooxygenase [Polaromonas sp.]|nr:antibiotic biosynthesis monooxygenase [Polaromonas sp.]